MDSPDQPPPLDGASALRADDFSTVTLHRFVGPGLGVVFDAPASWQDASDEALFQVIEPQTETQFTASGYENPGIPLREWAATRLAAVEKGMPFLKAVTAPYEMKGSAWSGIVAEYQGLFPERDSPSHYLVLCLRTDSMLISFTITANRDVFRARESLYRWLLEDHLDIYEVRKIDDPAQGFAKLREFSEQGDAEAQFSLAVFYEVGQGVAQDYQEAAAWYGRAGAQGHANAQFNLGVYYANGQGVAKNHEQAVAWWRQAAKQGYADAQFYLAAMYAQGWGVAQDIPQAVAWCRMAAAQGHADAQAQLAAIEGQSGAATH